MRHSLFFCVLAISLAGQALRADLLSGLIAYYPMDEGSGSTITEVLSGDPARYNGGAGAPDWTSAAPHVSLDRSQGECFASSDNGIGQIESNRFTLSAWIRPDEFNNWDGIISKGTTQLPYTFTLWGDGALTFATNKFAPAGGNFEGEWFSAAKMTELGRWYHVAVTYDGANVRFYLDGVKDTIEPWVPNIILGSVAEPLVIGGDLPGNAEHFDGAIRGVAIYDRALPDAEIASLAADETLLPARVSPGYAGLWVGEAELTEVREVATGDWTPAPAGFRQRVLWHVNSGGLPQLLSNATIMQTRVTAPTEPVQVIVTEPSLIPNYDGITPRGGKMVGQRFSSATTPIDGGSAMMAQDGETLSAELTQAPASPLNPFRHKYHPDLKTGIAIGRTLSFTVPAGDSPADNSFTGSFSETVTGLHQDAIEARGSVTFTRVSTAGTLNN